MQLTEFGRAKINGIDEYGRAIFAYVDEFGRRLSVAAAVVYVEYIAAPKYVLELHDSDGDLVAILQNAHSIAYAQMINSPHTLRFALPADDSKASDILLSNEIWLRDYKSGTVIKRFLLSRERDIRQ